MASEKKVVKGGFRATLAFIISLIALILSLVAYSKTSTNADLKGQIKEVQTKIENMKQDTSIKLDKLRQETVKTLEKMGQALKKENTE
jgi:fructose-1,6-bisphosphatase